MTPSLQDPNLETKDPLVENVMLLSGYALRAMKRHALLAITAFVLTVTLAVGFLAVSSPLYLVQTRVLVNDDDTMANLTQPRRPVVMAAAAADATQGVGEMIRSRDNVIWLIDRLNLLESWEKTRTPIGRALDKVFGALYGPGTIEQRRERLLNTVTEKISVAAEANLLTIGVEWHDPATAYAMAKALQENFFEQRKATEQNQIRETFTILERKVAESRRNMASAEEALHEAADQSNQMTAKAFDLRRNKNTPDLETVARLEREVAKRREAILRLETAYDARVNQAEATLNALRSTLGPGHPDVANAQRNLELQQRPPDGLQQLLSEESRMASQLNHLMPSITAARLFDAIAGPAGVDPGLEAALGEYRRKAEQNNDLNGRLEAAKIELDTANAAFIYRYVLTQPAVFPTEAVKPKPVQIMLVGIVAAAVLAFVSALLADLMSRRIQESWQITRFLGLPVLGEVEEA